MAPTPTQASRWRRNLGDADLVRDVPRTSSVMATSALRVQSLTRDDFHAATAGPLASRVAAEQLVSHRLDLVERADEATSAHDP